MKSLSHVQLLVIPIDGSPPGSSVHGIFQARVLKWVAIAFSSVTCWFDTLSPNRIPCILPLLGNVITSLRAILDTLLWLTHMLCYCFCSVPPPLPFSFALVLSHASLVAQTVKNLPAMQETLGWEDPLEKGMANSMESGAWWVIIHGVAKNRT